MEISRTTVPGTAVLHDIVTRDGQIFRIVAERSGTRAVHVYSPEDGEEVVATLVLEADEADHVADVLHSRPMPDRMADLERRIEELAGQLS